MAPDDNAQKGSGGRSGAEGGLDADFLARVGTRIRALRSERALTVQQLADRAQLSRRLLTQIELGQANPSLVTITRIARQLGADYTDLLGDPPAQTLVGYGRDSHLLVWSSEAGSTAHLLVATAGARLADLWRWRLAPGDTYQGQPDPTGSQELFHVLTGTLALATDEEQVVVPAGASARLRSDRRYSYTNAGDIPVEFVRTVVLTR